MDLFAHLPEIKLLLSMALGYVCYRKFAHQSATSALWGFSDDESLSEADQSPMQEEHPEHLKLPS